MSNCEKLFICIPSRDIIFEWTGMIYDAREHTMKTPRGKEISYYSAKQSQNMEYVNFFFKSKSDAESFAKYINGLLKKDKPLPFLEIKKTKGKCK